MYVIGSEVPIPGGETGSNYYEIKATKGEHVTRTIELTQRAFYALGLKEAWTRVIGLVVQPRIDFGNEWVSVPDYDSLRLLKESIESLGQRICYEAHSTDYQDEQNLKMLVEHHFAFLKVGPALSFALRESLYALEHIERNLYHGSMSSRLSGLQETMEQVMNEKPASWCEYCPDSTFQYTLKHFGLSDRTRYYLGEKRVISSINTLFSNLKGKRVPIGLVRQFLPKQVSMIESGSLSFEQPETIVRDAIKQILGVYHRASRKRVEFQH
jgi:D-tagatose-1,6-bisphosphate aldolase subunit GatZ/KbaZ